MISRHFALGAALAGLITCSVFLFEAGINPPSLLVGVLLLAITCLVPLTLLLFNEPTREGKETPFAKANRYIYPPAAICGILSLCLPPGKIAGTFGLGWMIMTWSLAVSGLASMLTRGFARFEETCLDIGRIFVGIGGVWFAFSRFGFNPLGFEEPIVTLTAVHFHFAGLFATVLMAMKGRQISEGDYFWRGLWKAAATLLLTGIPLLAAGITFSPFVELIGAGTLISGVLLYAIIGLATLSRSPNPTARIFLSLSCLSALYAMTWATLYAFHHLTGSNEIDVATMILHHGVANALGFCACGLFGWVLSPTIRRRVAYPPPFSKFYGGKKIGPRFFHNSDLIDEAKAKPRGLLDSFADYERTNFRSATIHETVRAFYERTDAHELVIVAHWRTGFKVLSVVYKQLSRLIGQMNLPTEWNITESRVNSVILPIRDEKDGRSNVRAWVRTYADSGKAVYVAAYANHIHESQTYMNIAFPLPGSNLTSILRLEEESRGGLVLTSLARRDHAGDEGVYWVNRFFSIRLPLNETITVWPSRPPYPVAARHDVWLFGFKFLVLQYRIRTLDSI